MLQTETIMNALKSSNDRDRLAAAKAAKQSTLKPQVFETWPYVSDWARNAAAFYGAHELLPLDVIRSGMLNSELEVRRAVYWHLRNTKISRELVMEAFREHPEDVEEMTDFVERSDCDLDEVKVLAGSDFATERIMAMRLAANHDIPLEVVRKGLSDRSVDVSQQAVKTARRREVSANTLKAWLERMDGDAYVRNVLKICKGRNDMLDELCAHLDSGYLFGLEAVVSVEGAGVPLEVLDRWRRGDYIHLDAFLHASVGRKDVPDDWISEVEPHASPESLLLARQGRKLAPIRRFEPGNVYLKCLNNVIVTASIPPEAEIFGDGQTGRTNLAYIEKVDGDFYGEKVGIQPWDCETEFRAGDSYENLEFYQTYGSGGSGLHFFCDRQAAEDFKLQS